ncbi:S8 family serine peptidase [Spirosoma taeanense]|uniref:S8 family serine peptidase n=1 Tax=Spirosoma taeanense TaxID=2735870 RepID=A0A6M5YBE6_9BACT|nr:S8 family peptidase [Spirosoma taeanense]QJW90656.1 S8 family serine peptidase [Spirosoma taeanense]
MRFSFSMAAYLKVAVAGLTLFGCSADRDVQPAGLSPDCLVKASTTSGQPIAGAYIVTFKEDPTTAVPNARQSVVSPQQSVSRLLTRHQITNLQTELLLTGERSSFLAHLTDEEATRLQADPAVESIEPDRVMAICGCVDVETPKTLLWNIQQTGYGRGDLQTNKTVWIIDTGIDLTHPDLNVDTERSVSFISGKTANDENGHGTHVAGIIGAKNNNVGVTGVASGARLVALKVLNQLGEGRLSGLLQAVNHVIKNGRAGDVVNMSLGGEGTSATLDRIVRQAADMGILFAIAAGNDGKDSDGYAPAGVNHPNVFTVSAMNRTNQFASFSNFGASVDVCAYGVRITSTYKNGQYATLSGTSMAAPHVAGLLLIRGSNLPTHGSVQGDPDGKPDPMAGQ